MQTVLIVFHLMVVVALVASVLLQRSEGGALGVGGSTGGFMTGRGQANALTRATAILATIFFITSLALSIIASYSRAPKSILDTVPQNRGTPQTAPTGNPLEQLRQLEQQRSGQAPATTSAPASATSTPAPATSTPAPEAAPAPATPAAPAQPEPPRSQ